MSFSRCLAVGGSLTTIFLVVSLAYLNSGWWNYALPLESAVFTVFFILWNEEILRKEAESERFHAATDPYGHSISTTETKSDAEGGVIIGFPRRIWKRAA